MSNPPVGSRNLKDLIEHALTLARGGIPCFPCNPADKSPWTYRGFKDATTDERQIKRWWCNQPDALIGVPTGLRFDALDVDPKHAGAMGWLARAGLPETRTHHTRSGGRHLLFRPTPGLRNSVSRIERGVDTRARGGYIIWWPAHGFAVEHPDLLAPMPQWIIDKLNPPPKAPAGENSERALEWEREEYRTGLDIPQRVLEAKIDGLIATVAMAREGERSNCLYWAARRFVEMVDAGLIDEGEAQELLLEAAQRAGHPDKRIKSTLDSAFSNRGGRS